jgi:hypothetical protein
VNFAPYLSTDKMKEIKEMMKVGEEIGCWNDKDDNDVDDDDDDN